MLAAFPKLIGTDNKQHTFVETEAVRYAGKHAICFAMEIVLNY
jgi:hypothetical protein